MVVQSIASFSLFYGPCFFSSYLLFYGRPRHGDGRLSPSDYIADEEEKKKKKKKKKKCLMRSRGRDYIRRDVGSFLGSSVYTLCPAISLRTCH
jgi:hypothetical protein